MAHTSHPIPSPTGPTEADGVNYRGIVWFLVVLFGTTLICQALMWGLFIVLEKQTTSNDTPRSAVSAAAVTPTIHEGRIVTANEVAPGSPSDAPPTLLVDEPANLHRFRAEEEHKLTSYEWEDKAAGIVRIPIERAKDMLLEKGIPGGTLTPGVPAKTDAKAGGRGGQD